MGEVIQKIPNLELRKYQFLIQSKINSDPTLLINAIKEDDMGPYYVHVAPLVGIKIDQDLLSQINSKNAESLALLDQKLQDATDNLGETEISECLLAKANHYSKIGDLTNAIAAFNLAIEKTSPLGHRIDLHFSLIRIAFLFDNVDLVSSTIEKVKLLIDEGGDWDRRNRLKTYQGIFLISQKDFKNAADFLLDTLGTFTSTELMPYKDFVRYAVLTAALTLSRTDFKKRVIQSPEVLEVIHEIPHLQEYTNSFYNCQYAPFFVALAHIEQSIKSDHIIYRHYRFYVREMRIRVYSQLLESYRSLTIESMANSFGVSEDWIDEYINLTQRSLPIYFSGASKCCD